MMTRIEKGIFNKGRVCGIADCMKHLAAERNGCLDEVCRALADEMCIAADDLFALLESSEAANEPALEEVKVCRICKVSNFDHGENREWENSDLCGPCAKKLEGNKSDIILGIF